MRRAFPDSDPGSGSRAIVGPKSGLPPMAADRIDAALSAERKRLLEVGASALDTLRAEGPGAVLSAEARLGIEAIVSVARPAMVLQDGAFGDPPPPWSDILGPFRQSIRTTAMSVWGGARPPPVAVCGNGIHGGRGCGDDQLPCGDGLLPTWSRRRVVVPTGPRGEPGPRRGPRCAAGRRRVAAQRAHRGRDRHPPGARPRAAAGHGRPGEALPIMSRDPGPLEGRMYVLGYPAPDYRNDAATLRSIFGDRYFVKRLQPGAAMAPPADAIIGWSPARAAPSRTT